MALTWKVFKKIARLIIWPPLAIVGVISLYNVWGYLSSSLVQPSLPVVLYIQPGAPLEGVLAATQAADDWNKALGKPVIKIETTNLSCRSCLNNNRNDLTFRNDQFSHDNAHELAVTRTEISIKHPGTLGETDVVVWDFIRTFSLKETTYESGEVEKMYLRRVLVHEFGHVLGLGHFFVPGSIMQPNELDTYFGYLSDHRLESSVIPSKFDLGLVKGNYKEYFDDRRETK